MTATAGGVSTSVKGLFVLVGLLALTPYLLRFAGMGADAAGPFAGLLLRLAVPLMFVAFVVSLGSVAS